MEKITVTVAPEGNATIEYEDGRRVGLSSEQWARLQAAKLRSMGQYGPEVTNAWYYQTLQDIKFLSL